LSKGRKGAKNDKFEARKRPRGSKQIQDNEKQNNYNAPNGRIEFTVLDFLILNLFWHRFVSDFVLRIADLPCGVCFDPLGFFRYSELEFASLVAWRDNLFCHFSV